MIKVISAYVARFAFGMAIIVFILAVLPNWAMPSAMENAFTWLFNGIWTLNPILPVSTLLWVFFLIIAVDVFFLTIKIILFFYRLVVSHIS